MGNLFWFVFKIHIPGGGWILPIFGLLAGIFIGCWAMALAEMLEAIPNLCAAGEASATAFRGVILGTAAR